MPPPSPQPEDLFLLARELGEREREAFLVRACDADDSLREAVEDLLAADRQADIDGFLLGEMIEPDSRSTPSGQTIGGYRIQRELGRGGQATVYLAHDASLDRMVALKVLAGLEHPNRASTLAQRFRREASALASLDHPGLCSIHDSGVDGGVAWIAMRYVDGATLAELLGAHELGLERALATMHASGSEGDEDAPGNARGLRLARLFEQVARALHAAHERGVVHRDVKPANVMITADGQPVLLDFGVAHAMQDDDGPGLTKTAEVLGTPSYLAPEQICADGRIDARSDVYSLGVTIYESLCGRLPFEAVSRDALYHQILAGTPPRLRSLAPGLSRDLEVVVMTSLEKDPGRRYVDAAAFADDLRRVTRFQPIRARRVGVVGRLHRWVRRQPLVAASVLLAFVGLVGGLVASLISLDVANDSIDRLQSERAARFDSLSRSVAFGFQRGEISMALPEWQRIGRRLVTEAAPDLDVDAMLAAFAMPDWLTIDAAVAGEVAADLQRRLPEFEGVARIALADVLLEPLRWLLSFLGYHLPADPALSKAAIALAEIRLDLLRGAADATRATTADPRPWAAGVALLDVLIAVGEERRVIDLATEWLSADSPMSVEDFPTRRAVYESRLAMAELRLGLHEIAHERLARCVPVVAAAFRRTSYDLPALAAAVRSHERGGGAEIWPDQRQELVRRIVGCDIEGVNAAWWVWMAAFRPEDRRLRDHVHDGMVAFTVDRSLWATERTVAWCAQCEQLVGEHLDATDPTRWLVAKFVKYISQVGRDVHGLPEDRDGMPFLRTVLSLYGVTFDPQTGGPRVPDAVRNAHHHELSGAMLRVARGLWWREHRREAARLWYRATLDSAPDDTVWHHVWHHRLGGIYGRFLKEIGEYDEAERRLLRALEIDTSWHGVSHPEWARRGYRMLSELWRLRGRHRQAVQWDRRQLQPGHAGSQYRLAETHFLFGLHADARRRAEQVLALDPEFAVARVLLARIALAQSRYDDAIEHAEQAEAAGNEHALHVRAHALAARGGDGDAAAALACFRAAPWSSFSWSDKALALHRAGDPSVEERMLARVVGPNDILGSYAAARFLLAIGKPSEALPYAECAADSCGAGRARVVALLAEVQFQNGMHAEARATAARCLELMGGQDACEFSIAEARRQFGAYQ